MKKIALIISLTAAMQLASAATVVYGNSTPFTGDSRHSPNYLLGSEITIDQQITLQDVGIIFRSAGYAANFGLYSDMHGSPDRLLDSTGVFIVFATGDTHQAFQDSSIITPGIYWLMGVFDGPASVGKNFGSSMLVAYNSLSDISALPATFGAALTYSGTQLNYYITGATVDAVPEPETYVMLLAGLGALGVVARRRKSL